MNQNQEDPRKYNKSIFGLLLTLLTMLMAGSSIDVNLSELKLKIEQENPISQLIQKCKSNN
ncbi:MAG: hypothetical protein F6K54_09410 [Okeania sp. SIO3B5]|uniref:hypothetical protein n=1 Tax=Okeania sp. SIO3B5 TaxID=2607811 RepID=UPI0013FF68A5|nr:hypothetical protein [Okeania sp. SIO3B5]NEO53276.1 hypothetical protein [Okeania sp. SIO3B5]